MKYWILKGDLPTNIQEHFQAVEINEEEMLLMKFTFGEGNSVGQKIRKVTK